MQVKLKPRLATIAKFIPEGSTVADIGTDHGYLPVHLLTEKIASRAIAADIHEKPLSYARELVEMLNFNRKIDVRLGDGLQVLEPDEADVVVIAGMGGSTIIHILEASPEVLKTVNRLVLQPMLGALSLRKWLTGHGFKIVDETLVEDDKIIYEIIVAEHGESSYTEEEIFIGPMLLQNKPPLLKEFLELQYQRTTNVLKELEKSVTTLNKREDYKHRLEILQKVMACL